MTATFIFTDRTRINFRVDDKKDADNLAFRSFPGKVIHTCGPWCGHSCSVNEHYKEAK